MGDRYVRLPDGVNPDRFPKKSCLACGKALKRKRYANGRIECITHFSKRKTCDAECGRKLISMRANREPETRVCPVCHTTFSRPEDVDSWAFSRRKSCGSVVCTETVRLSAFNATIAARRADQ